MFAENSLTNLIYNLPTDFMNHVPNTLEEFCPNRRCVPVNPECVRNCVIGSVNYLERSELEKIAWMIPNSEMEIVVRPLTRRKRYLYGKDSMKKYEEKAKIAVSDKESVHQINVEKVQRPNLSGFKSAPAYNDFIHFVERPEYFHSVRKSVDVIDVAGKTLFRSKKSVDSLKTRLEKSLSKLIHDIGIIDLATLDQPRQTFRKFIHKYYVPEQSTEIAKWTNFEESRAELEESLSKLEHTKFRMKELLYLDNEYRKRIMMYTDQHNLHHESSYPQSDSSVTDLWISLELARAELEKSLAKRIESRAKFEESLSRLDESLSFGDKPKLTVNKIVRNLDGEQPSTPEKLVKTERKSRNARSIREIPVEGKPKLGFNRLQNTLQLLPNGHLMYCGVEYDKNCFPHNMKEVGAKAAVLEDCMLYYELTGPTSFVVKSCPDEKVFDPVSKVCHRSVKCTVISRCLVLHGKRIKAEKMRQNN